MQSPGSSQEARSPPAPLPTGQDAAKEAQLEHLPAPASEYKRFTARNLELARLVAAELAEEPDPDLKRQNEVLSRHGGGETFDFDLRELVQPPSLQGVIDRGGWEVFGVRNPIVELSSSLAEMGIPQLFDATQDRRTSLKKLLNTVLVHYVQLLDELVKPPPGGGPRTAQAESDVVEPPYQADILIDQIRLACLNMHMLVNELRPMQARETLQNLMRSQIDRRKARTEQLKRMCSAASAVLSDLNSRYDVASMETDAQTPAAEIPADANRIDQAASTGDADWQRLTDAVEALT